MVKHGEVWDEESIVFRVHNLDSHGIRWFQIPCVRWMSQDSVKINAAASTTLSTGASLFGILTAVAVLLGVAWIPILLVEIPPLADYPNHMARMHILADAGRSPVLTQYYEIHWNILPNLAMDVIVPPLAQFMPLETAGKVFIGLTLALLALGVMTLHAALHKRWSPWPLLAFFFLYNSVFLWGFLNYLFGLGLGLFACAAWVTLRDRSAAVLIPLFSVVATLLFFAHLFAFGVFATVVLAYEIGQWWRQERHDVRSLSTLGWKSSSVIAVPLILLLLSPTFKANPDYYAAWSRRSMAPTMVEFAPLSTKVEAFKGTIRTERQTLDRVTALALMGLVGVGLVWRHCVILPAMYLPLTVVALTALALPYSIGTTSFVNIRMPIVFLLLSIASSDWPVIRWRWLIPTALLLGALFMLRMIYITDHWLDTDRHYREFVRQLDELPQGAKLFQAMKASSIEAYHPDDASIPESMPMDNLSCWGVIRRGMFVSNIFAAPGQQPLQLNPAVRHLLTLHEFVITSRPIPWDRISGQYDYVVIRRNQRLTPPVPAHFTPVGAGEEFQFYRIDREGSEAR
jgi:hypothetical protein